VISQYPKCSKICLQVLYGCYRSNEPFLSVFMWGVNHTVKELKHVSVPGKIFPHPYHFRTQGRTQGGCTGCTCIPPPPPVHPPRPCASPPSPAFMRKDEAVGNKKKMQVCLPKHNYKLDNNLLTVEPRAVDPHCFDADPEPDLYPAQNLDADADPDPDPDPGGGGGRSDKNVHPPWQNPRYAPVRTFRDPGFFF
jgi:hypothetical protein